jgi:hypothetical protein
MKIQLKDACNAMCCGCGTPFCYVCGEPAREGSDHWIKKPNGCPKYGPRDATNPIFEAPMRQPVLRFVEPPRPQRHPLDDLEHGPDGLRFAGLRIADEAAARNGMYHRERRNTIAYPAMRDEDRDHQT